MKEETYRKWDITVKALAPLVTILGLLIGVWQFSRGQAAQLEREYKLLSEKDRLEFKQRTWEKQLEVYTKVSNVVGKIASENLSDNEVKKATSEFYALYWGDMLYVEDKAVADAMKDFNLEIQDYLKGTGTRDRLKIRALNACRVVPTVFKEPMVQSMRLVRSHASFVLLGLLLLAFGKQTVAQTNYDIYYIAVGNSHYASDQKRGGFKNLEGSNKSAKRVAEYLARAGAINGITLVSEPAKIVTKKDVLSALDQILSTIKRSKPKNPLLVFYFCGHGLSEGFGWNHFSVPGDFFVSPDKINVDTLSEAGIYAGDVSDAAESNGLACLLLLDSCYEGSDLNLTDAVLSAQLATNIQGVAQVIRYMNEFHGPSLAVFSTRPGTVVRMVADPVDVESQLAIGPLARRFLMSFEQAFQTKKQLSINQFLQQMSSTTFDPTTSSVLTLSKPDRPAMQLIKYPLLDNNQSQIRFGTGRPLP